MNRVFVNAVLGLKIRIKREQKGFTPTQLSKISGVSKSYLNEIENGKKYPKSDKLMSLAQALDISYNDLVSLEFQDEYQILNEPLQQLEAHMGQFETLGLNLNMIAELFLKNPTETVTFILSSSNLFSLPSIKPNHLVDLSLNAHKQMYQHYFAHLEQMATSVYKSFSYFSKELTVKSYLEYLEQKYNVQFRPITTLPNAVDIPITWFFDTTSQTLYRETNSIDTAQQLFAIIQLHYFLVASDITQKTYYLPQPTHEVYQVALHYYYSSYFAKAVLWRETTAVKTLQKLFKSKSFNTDALNRIAGQYQLPPAQLLHRITCLLQKHFQVSKFVFMSVHPTANSLYHNMHIEARFTQLDFVESEEFIENYCTLNNARKMLKNVNNQDSNVNMQYANLHVNHIVQPIIQWTVTSKDEASNTMQTHNLILFINENMKQQLPFLNHMQEQPIDLGLACQSCIVDNCPARVCEPYVVLKSAKNKALQKALEQLNR